VLITYDVYTVLVPLTCGGLAFKLHINPILHRLFLQCSLFTPM